MLCQISIFDGNGLVAKSCLTLATLWTVACKVWTVDCKAPLSMGFSRQEDQSGLPCHSPDLPDPGPRDLTGVSYVSCIGRWILYYEHHLKPIFDMS